MTDLLSQPGTHLITPSSPIAARRKIFRVYQGLLREGQVTNSEKLIKVKSAEMKFYLVSF